MNISSPRTSKTSRRAVLMLIALAIWCFAVQVQAQLVNGSFESPTVEGSGYSYGTTGATWSFANGAGLTANGTAFTGGNPNAPDGTQSLFLQGAGSASQTLRLAAGTYTFSYKAAQRGNWQSGTQTVRASLDGINIGSFQPPDVSYSQAPPYSFTVVGGNHTLVLTGVGSGSDYTSFVDDVRLQASAVASSTITMNASLNPVFVNQSVTLSATVVGASPSGSVSFLDGSNILGSTPLVVDGGGSSLATLTLPFGSDGAHSLTANYAGDSSNTAVTSAATILQVNAQGAGPTNPQSIYTQARTSSFEYYSASDGSINGLLKSETIEPGNPQLCMTTTYVYDAYGNKSSASTANCSGADSNVRFASRSSSSTYAEQTITVAGVDGITLPAGTLPTSSTNALGQSDSKIYDPRFGEVVRLTGPNALTTIWTLDDFGRVVTESRADGTSSVSYYCYIAGRVSDASSNTSGCPKPSAAEIPTDAVAYVHKEPRDSAGIKSGPFNRIYTDRAGRQLSTVNEAFDGADQPGGANRLIVQETVYSIYGTPSVVTQPYFLDSGSSTASRNANDAPYGMQRTDYDVLGRPVAAYSTDPANPGNQGGSQASVSFSTRGSRQASFTHIVYSGLSVTTTDDKGNTRLEEKNVNGSVVRVTDALGAQVAFQHDAFGNLVTTKDALQNLVQVAYDVRGRKISMTDPDAGVWGYCYDAVGDLVAQQNSKMRGSEVAAACPGMPNTGAVANSVAGWTTLAYDVLGRLASRVEPEYASTWTYDSCAMGVGKLCEVNSTNGVKKKSFYDTLGRPFKSRTTIADGPSFASVVAYNATNGRPASMTYPTGLQVSYGYTAKGFLSSLYLATAATVNPLPATPGGTPAASTALPAGSLLWRANAFNAWGRSEKQTYGNGVVNQAVFDAATGRVTLLTAGTGGGANVASYSYVWDSIGRVAQRTDNNGDGNTGAVSDTFTYDAISRMTQYVVNAPSIANLQRTVTLQYNALGMTLYKSDVGNYTYGSQNVAGVRPHALQSLNGAFLANYGYDGNGNLISASAGKYAAISYTSFNLPDSNTGAQGPAGTPKYTWQYDENHQRVNEIQVGANGIRTTWEIHPDNLGGLAFESESSITSPTPSNRHYLSVGSSTIGVLVSTGALPDPGIADAPPTLSSITLVKVEYWHKESLGSLIATTDHFANVTARYAYDPFGKRRQTNGTYDAAGNLIVDWTTDINSGTNRGFTGHEHLDDIGIIHMNGRTFDPTLGRFMQVDPLIQAPDNLQSYDRYAYCLNNSLTCIDPSGHSWLTHTLKRLWHDKIVRSAVIIVVAYYTGGYALDAYASSSAATAGYAAASSASAAGLTATEYGIESYSLAYGSAYTAAASSVTGGAIAGSASGFAGGFVGSDGNLKAGIQGAITGAASGGINNVYGSSYPPSRIAANSAAGGLGAVIRGNTFASGARSSALISSLAYLNSLMREQMLDQSMHDPRNDGTGLSHGMNGDGRKLAGGRWYEGADLVKDRSPLGGWQNEAGSVFGHAYASGGLTDMVVESFAGPHDWANHFTWYVNSPQQVLEGFGMIGDALPRGDSPFMTNLLEYTTNKSTSLIFALPFATSAILEQTSVATNPYTHRRP